jgi:hypothetical protein
MRKGETMLAQDYGVQLVGPYGTELVGADTKTFVGLYPWQWMFTGAAGILTATGAYVAHRGTKQAKAAAGIGALGGVAGGLLLALAFGRA